MRRKVLQGYANTICDVFLGWRGRCDDPVLAELGSGTLVIDVLTGTATHDGVSVIEPTATGTFLYRWLREQAERHRVPLDGILRAELVVRYTVEPWDWEIPLWTLGYPDVRSRVVTAEREYTGSLPVFSAGTQR